MTEEEKLKDLQEIGTKVSNIVLALIEKNVKKLKDPKLKNHFEMIVALNVMGNVGIKVYLEKKEDAKDIEKFSQVAAKTLTDVTEWFSAVMTYNAKQGMN